MKFIQICRKILFIILIVLIFPLFLTQSVKAQTGNNMMGGFGASSIILVPTELGTNEIVNIDGNKDALWTTKNYEDLTIDDSIPLRLYCAYDSVSLYFYLEIEFLRAWDVVNETVSFNFQSSSPINYTNTQTGSSGGAGQGMPEGFDASTTPPFGDGTFTPPSGDFPSGNTGDLTSRARRSNYNLTNIDDRKAITITNGFYKPATDTYTVSYVDQYVYSDTDDSETTTYSYENDLDRSSCRGAAYNGPYGRFYELQFDLSSEDSQNDLIISDTDACILYLGIQASDETVETVTVPIQIQFFEPSTEEETTISTDTSYTKIAGYIFLAICVVVTVVLGIMTFQARSNLKKKSIRVAFADVNEYVKELDDVGEERTEEELRDAENEEHQFLNWLDQDLDPSEVEKTGRPVDAIVDTPVSIRKIKNGSEKERNSDFIDDIFDERTKSEAKKEEDAFLRWLDEDSSDKSPESGINFERSEKILPKNLKIGSKSDKSRNAPEKNSQKHSSLVSNEKTNENSMPNRMGGKIGNADTNEKRDKKSSTKKSPSKPPSVEEDDYFLNWNN